MMQRKRVVSIVAVAIVAVFAVALALGRSRPERIVPVPDSPKTGSDKSSGITEEEVIGRVRTILGATVPIESIVARRMTVRDFSALDRSSPGRDSPVLDEKVWVVAFTTHSKLSMDDMPPDSGTYTSEGYPNPDGSSPNPTATAITFVDPTTDLTTGYYVLYTDGSLYGSGILSPLNSNAWSMTDLAAFPTALP